MVAGDGRRRFLQWLVLVWTFGFTVARGLRAPNDFAEAHWLLDYRFGFIKRGLIGSLCSLATTLTGTSMTPASILFLSTAATLATSAVVLLVLFQTWRRFAWSDDAYLTVLAFVSSPFAVMAGHLVGYFDGLLLMAAIAAIALVRKDRPWSACLLSTAAILAHESYLLVGLPLVLLALVSPPAHHRKRALVQAVCLPALAFVAVAIVQRTTDAGALRQQLAAHLHSFGFVHDRSDLVALWQTIPITQFFQEHAGRMGRRLLDPDIFLVVAPTLMAMLLLLHAAYAIRPMTSRSLLVAGAVAAPLAMHAVAWDTARISAQTLPAAAVALWVSGQQRVPRPAALVLLAAVPALIINVFARVPLMDGEIDRFTSTQRCILYLPALLAMGDVVARVQRSGQRGNNDAW